jgi:hypothetical protein
MLVLKNPNLSVAMLGRVLTDESPQHLNKKLGIGEIVRIGAAQLIE